MRSFKASHRILHVGICTLGVAKKDIGCGCLNGEASKLPRQSYKLKFTNTVPKLEAVANYIIKNYNINRLINPKPTNLII